MNPTEIFNCRQGLAAEGIQMSSMKPSLNGLLPGVIFPQNIPSMMVAHELNLELKPEHLILDMCAAPGGTNESYEFILRENTAPC